LIRSNRTAATKQATFDEDVHDAVDESRGPDMLLLENGR